MKKLLLTTGLIASINASAVLGPIPIYLNTEYRTEAPIIGGIASTISFDSGDIKQSGSKNLLDFLHQNSGITAFNPTGNVPSVFIRGANASHTLILLDGADINDISANNGAGYNLDNISIDNIEKIDIVKGGGSTLYGSNAIAGVIAITTKKGGDNITQATLNFGSHNTKDYKFTISNGDTNNYVKFDINKYITDGISAKTDNSEKDGKINQTANLKMGVNIKDTNIDLSIISNSNLTHYDGCGLPSSNDCYSKNYLDRANINIKTHFDKISSNLSFTQSDMVRDQYTNNIINAGEKFKSSDLTLLNNIHLENTQLNIGLSRIINKNKTKNFKLSNNDVFINMQKKLDTIDLSLGFRNINHNKFGNKLIYNLGGAKNFNNGIRLSANHNSAFRSPALSEIFDGPWTGGNSALQPEIAKNTSISLTRGHSWGKFNTTLFYNQIKDIIVYSDTATVDYFNRDELVIKGVELSIDANLQGYNLHFSHNYVNSKIENQEAVRRPKNITNFAISKAYNKFNTKINLTRKSSSLDWDRSKMSSYYIADMYAEYHYNEKTTFNLSIKNIFNKNYEIAKGYNQLGRVFNIGLTHNF